MSGACAPDFIIGYKSVTQADVIAALQAAEDELPADIRAVRLSPRPGFSGDIFADRSRKADIDYGERKTLGLPKTGRDTTRGSGGNCMLERGYVGSARTARTVGTRHGPLLIISHERPTCGRSKRTRRSPLSPGCSASV